ncbi:MAG: hypothetical protein ACE5IW_00440 [bacterium]
MEQLTISLREAMAAELKDAAEKIMTKRNHTELVHEGQYVAEVDVVSTQTLTGLTGHE